MKLTNLNTAAKRIVRIICEMWLSCNKYDVRMGASMSTYLKNLALEVSYDSHIVLVLVLILVVKEVVAGCVLLLAKLNLPIIEVIKLLSLVVVVLGAKD